MSLAVRLKDWLVRTAQLVAFLMLLSGRPNLGFLWAYAAVVSVLLLGFFLTIDPELLAERRRPAPGGEDRGGWILLGTLALAHVVIATLDRARFHWSDTVPLWLRTTGLALFALGMGTVVWSMAVNPFFSPVVRIQAERGHVLVRAGPYRYLRHPGYAGMVTGLPGSALALGSWWALLPAIAFAALAVRRVLLEDPFLMTHLAGYRDYALHVRYRIFPGIW